MKKNLTFLLVCFIFTSIQAQLSPILYKPFTQQKEDTVYPKINLEAQYLGFVKNNEYFNLIADGYTLLGHQLDLTLKLQTSKNYKFFMGIDLQKYMGLNDFEKPIPYIGLEIYKGKSTFYFGKLNTSDNHHLSEPLYDFERHLDDRHIENGLEHRFKNAHWQTDTWLEWEHFIFKEDSLRERLNFGQTTTYTKSFGSWQIRWPLQLYIMHRGGQINIRTVESTTYNNAMVIANYATGLQLEKHLTQYSLGLAYTYFGHQINSDNVEELHFKNGEAHQVQIFIRHHAWQHALSYWQAYKFVAPKGNPIYQSISYRVEKYINQNGQQMSVFTDYTEPNRSLLTWKSIYQKEIYKNLQGAFVLDLYYQLNESSIENPYYTTTIAPHLDYAMAIYLCYKFNFKILNIK